MRQILFAILILVTTVAYGQRSQGDSFIDYYTAPDKILHAGAGFGIAGLSTTMYATARPDEPLINAWGVGLLIGWGAGGLKELSDWKLGTGTADHGDVMATGFGAALGAGFTVLGIKISRTWNERRAEKRRVVATNPITGQRVKLR